MPDFFDKWFVKIWLVGMAFIAGLMVYAAALAIYSSSVNSRCLKAGYPDYRVERWNGYCVKKILQTDIVVAVEDLDQ